MFKAKLVVVGPCKSGKSSISNFLGDQGEAISSVYRPTIGVRILEFESSISTSQGHKKIDVELWDCSGNESCEGCWPALASDADGVVLVYDPADVGATPSIETFYKYFVSGQNIKDEHCLVFANCKSGDEKSAEVSSPFPAITFEVTNLEEDPETVRSAFNNLLQSVFVKLSASREKQELSILT